jgi:putative endonuclease
MPREHQYFNYIATNKWNTVLYTGMTNNLQSRTLDYKVNRHPKSFAGKHNINKLVYYSSTNDVNAAIAEEKRIKGGSRKKKIQMIEEMNPEWKDLSEEIGLDEEDVEVYRKYLDECGWDEK